MTKHASLHNHRRFPSRNESQRSFSRSRIQNRRRYTNTVSSSNSSQGVAATYRSIDGPRLNCCLENPNVTRCYPRHYIREIPNSAAYTCRRPFEKNVTTRSDDNNIQVAKYYPDNCSSLPQYLSNANYAVNVYNQDAATIPFIAENSLAAVESSNRSSDRPVSPISISTTDGLIAPCGGHCRTCEKFCHYFLLVLFVAGILIGVCLVLAGYILHGQKRGGDLLVLVYIGALTAIVCTLLLSIQCNVRRDVKRRKRKRATMMMARGRTPLANIPLRDLRTATIAVPAITYQNNDRRNHRLEHDNSNGLNPTAKYSHQLVTDNADYPVDIQSPCEMPLMHGGTAAFKPLIRSYDEMSQSQNGIPWWRRTETQVTYKYGNIV